MYQPALTDHRIVGGVAALAALALFPFTLLHFARDASYEAIVNGGLNAAVALGAAVAFLWRSNPRLIRLSGLVMVGLANAAAVLMIQAQGGQTAYWIFPIIFANFYLLPFAAGTALSLVFAALGLFAAAPSVPAEYFLRLLVTTPLCIFFGVVFSHSMARQRSQLQHLATHDALTGAGNRHGMERDLIDAVARMARYGEACSLVILDIDHFKTINDRIGHMRADALIVELAELLKDRIRSVDRFYRFGGEEFVLLLPHAGTRACWQLAEALRMEVEEHRFGDGLPITFSAGIAELEPGENADDWLRRADDALYRAKELGRNRVLAARPAADVETGEAPPVVHRATAWTAEHRRGRLTS